LIPPIHERSRYVDGIRAIAILSVLVFHAEYHIHTLYRSQTSSFADNWGAQGVTLFFVISGFCLSYGTLSALTRHDTSFDLATYFVKRIWRVFPPFLIAAIFLFAFVAIVRHMGGRIDELFHEPQNIGEAFGQLAMFDRSGRWINPSFWSLPIELRWYAVFPFALALFISSRRAFFSVLALLVIGHEVTRLWHSEDIARLPTFMLGIVAADLAVRKESALRWSLPGIAVGVVAGQLQGLFDPATDFADRFGWHLACFCFVATVVSDKRFQSVLAWRPLAAIGVASYSIYLIHDPLVTVVENISPDVSRTPGVEALFVSLSLLVGSIFYLIVERPLQRQAVVRNVQAHGVPLAERLLRNLGFPRTLTFRHELFSRVAPSERERLEVKSPGSAHGDVDRERVPNLA